MIFHVLPACQLGLRKELLVSATLFKISTQQSVQMYFTLSQFSKIKQKALFQLRQEKKYWNVSISVKTFFEVSFPEVWSNLLTLVYRYMCTYILCSGFLCEKYTPMKYSAWFFCPPPPHPPKSWFFDGARSTFPDLQAGKSWWWSGC